MKKIEPYKIYSGYFYKPTSLDMVSIEDVQLFSKMAWWYMDNHDKKHYFDKREDAVAALIAEGAENVIVDELKATVIKNYNAIHQIKTWNTNVSKMFRGAKDMMAKDKENKDLWVVNRFFNMVGSTHTPAHIDTIKNKELIKLMRVNLDIYLRRNQERISLIRNNIKLSRAKIEELTNK